MAEPAVADPTPEAAPAPSQVDPPADPATPEAAPDLATQLETVQKELRRVRRENQTLRHRTDPAPADPSVPVTEVEKLKRERERIEAERESAVAALRAERTSRLAEREAQAAHAVYPDLVAALLEKDLEYEDGDDKPTNLNTLLGKFRRQYPLLFRAPSGDGGAGGTPPPGSPMNSLIRQMAGRR